MAGQRQTSSLRSPMPTHTKPRGDSQKGVEKRGGKHARNYGTVPVRMSAVGRRHIREGTSGCARMRAASPSTCWRLYGLVTHYSINGLDSACGRSSQTLVSSISADAVSCKSCQRSLVKAESSPNVRKSPSLADLRQGAQTAVAQASASGHGVIPPRATGVRAVSADTPTEAAAVAAPAAPRAGGFSVKAAYAARLAEQQGQSRLPRGKRVQRHV